MWPHQSSLREILRCVCYEKMEGSWASCAASRGAFGFLRSPRLANFQERGALALDACHHFPKQPCGAPTPGQLRQRHPELPLFWGRRAQMCWVTARFPEMTGTPAPLPRRPDVPASASQPRMPLITRGKKLSPTISSAHASLCQTPRKELIFSAAVCIERIERL